MTVGVAKFIYLVLGSQGESPGFSLHFEPLPQSPMFFLT